MRLGTERSVSEKKYAPEITFGSKIATATNKVDLMVLLSEGFLTKCQHNIKKNLAQNPFPILYMTC